MDKPANPHLYYLYKLAFLGIELVIRIYGVILIFIIIIIAEQKIQILKNRRTS